MHEATRESKGRAASRRKAKAVCLALEPLGVRLAKTAPSRHRSRMRNSSRQAEVRWRYSFPIERPGNKL